METASARASGLRCPPPADLRLQPGRVVRDLVFVMLCLEALVLLLDAWLYCGGVIASPELRTLFDASSEEGLAAWLGVTQSGLLALTLWAMAGLYGQAGLARRRRLGWTVLAACFSYLALDDGVGLHERIGTAFAASEAAEVGIGGAFPSYYWQLLLGPAFAAMGLFVLAFLWRELRTARRRLLLCGALILLALAVAMDFVEGLNPAHPLNVYAALAMAGDLEPLTERLFGLSAYGAVLHFGMALEEVIEMAAMTMLWAAVLRHLGATTGGVHLRWVPAEEQAAPEEAAVLA